MSDDLNPRELRCYLLNKTGSIFAVKTVSLRDSECEAHAMSILAIDPDVHSVEIWHLDKVICRGARDGVAHA